MIAIEINTAIKDFFSDEGSPYAGIDITPLFAYNDSSGPFIVYYEFPGTQSEEQFFLRVSNVIYYVYDNDIDRASQIARKLDEFLNVGDEVEYIKSRILAPYYYGYLNYRLTTSRLVSGSMMPPPEREGFSVISRNYRMVYVNVD